MADMTNSYACEPAKASSALSMHKESHVISKFKPKIRIVHIFAPEIIKTDVANFRELVQRLTGKPAARKGSKKRAKKAISSSSDLSESSYDKMSEGSEFGSGFQNLGCDDRVKEEEEYWGGVNSNFFGGLGDLDGFIQGLSEFPMVPLSSSQMDGFGESHLN